MRMTMMMTFLAAAALAGCYLSEGRSRREDAATDARQDPPRDARADDAAADDAGPGRYRFVDRDIPDRSVPVDLLFANVPSVAFNGRVAGLVYLGMERGSDERIGFVPLGPEGELAGPETVILRSGVHGSIPRISHAGDGSFLVATVVEAATDSFVVLRVDETGAVLASGSAPPIDNVFNPRSPPLRIGGHVYAAANSFQAGGYASHFFRFAWPSLAFEMTITYDADVNPYEEPVIAPVGGSSGFFVFAQPPSSAAGLVLQEFTDDIDPATLDVDIPFERPVVEFFAAAGAGGSWILHAIALDGEGAALHLLSVDSRWERGARQVPASFFGGVASSCAADRPVRGALVTSYVEDRWEAWVWAEAFPGTAEETEALVQASDAPGSRRMDDIAWPSIAWTGDGFLAAWDEWRDEETYAVFTSYVALERI